MSAATFVPGTPSTSLARRMVLALRLAVTARPAAGARAKRPVPPRTTGEAAHPAIMDPLDDLRNATWQDAEWQ